MNTKCSRNLIKYEIIPFSPLKLFLFSFLENVMLLMLRSLKMRVPTRLFTGNKVNLKIVYLAYARNDSESIRMKVRGFIRLRRILGQDTTLARSDKLLYFT